MSTALTVNEIGRDQIEVWKRTFCKGANDDELKLFISTCQRTGLSPEARQIYMVPRWDSKLGANVMTPQTSIDGFRVIAERSGHYVGQVGPFFTDDGKWSDVWLKDGYPKAAKVGILRNDFKEPMWAIARWESYVQTNKSGQVTNMWHKMPDIMLAKCAEALALRKAFPQDLSGLYTSDEVHYESAPVLDREVKAEKVHIETVSHAAPEKLKKIFNMHDEKQRSWMMNLLEGRKISEDARQAVIEDLDGKDILTDLEPILEKAICGEY
jgi:phage recombination protein Bet